VRSKGVSSSSEAARVADAARTPGWSVGVDGRGRVMATRASGEVGLSWVVLAERSREGLRVSLFQPGDDVDAGGEVLGALSGSARERGRQLRALLVDVELRE
jgi:hypothetical protein